MTTVAARAEHEWQPEATTALATDRLVAAGEARSDSGAAVNSGVEATEENLTNKVGTIIEDERKAKMLKELKVPDALTVRAHNKSHWTLRDGVQSA